MKNTAKFLLSYFFITLSFTLITFAQTQKEGAKGVFDKEDQLQNGVAVRFYEINNVGIITSIPQLIQGQTPNISIVVPQANFANYLKNFNQITGSFFMNISGFIEVPKTQSYTFRLRHSNVAQLKIDNKVVINNQLKPNIQQSDAEVELTAGKHTFEIDYCYHLSHQNSYKEVTLWWYNENTKQFEYVPEKMLFTTKGDVKVTAPGIKNVLASGRRSIPGDAQPLAGVHPSYDLFQLRKKGFEPKIAGMDFLPDGRLVFTTWDSLGQVYVVSGVETGDTNKITYKRIAWGLAEPLGVKVVDSKIYVLQKQELTQLIDHNGDEIIDEYKAICNGWGVTPNFHEFAFGLVYKDGFFYANLAVAINPGGKSTNPQNPDRGKVIQINSKDGSYKFVAEGLRTPNGITLHETDGKIYLTDNQGDWIPSCKLLQLEEGAFYGSYAVNIHKWGEKVTNPVAWFPQNEIGNSTSQPITMRDGIYKGQMLVADVTHGGIKRIFIEEVNGVAQGAVFRFSQGLEAGTNRLAWGKDGGLYIGGIGSTGNWGQTGKERFGLQKIKFNGKSTFEMLEVRAKANGIEITFTEPLKEGYGINPKDYTASSWTYIPTPQYGGSKKDEKPLQIQSVTISADRRKAFLAINELKKLYVHYIRLTGTFISENDNELWTTETWFTINEIPEEKVEEKPIKTMLNQLTEAEKTAGWQLLFDGKTTKGWRNYNKKTINPQWVVTPDGTLQLTGKGGGDIITEKQYKDFELNLEWKISEWGNSGIFYRGIESEKYKAIYVTAPEMQVLDNERHKDAQIFTHRSGDNYDLMACKFITVRPAGEWNQVRLIIKDNKVQHWLNGYKVVEYTLGSDEWKELVAKSKFPKMSADYGTAEKGYIGLQDHSDVVWFRNIKIKEL